MTKLIEKSKKIFKNIITFKIKSNFLILIGIISVLVVIILIPAIIKANYLANEKIEIEKLSTQEELELLQMHLDKYKEEVADVVRIRDSYRNSIKEIVELLYVKDTHIGIGGYGGNSIEITDEVNLLTIRNIIASMEDDQRLLVEVKNYLEVRRDFIQSFPFIWPVDTGGVPHVSSGYGFREDLFGQGEDGIHLHKGIDIDLAIGTPVVSTAGGTVLFAFVDEVMGKIIVVRHQNGFTTSYAHLDRFLVKMGDTVKRGDKIGTVGNTGLTTGPHIHYEIRQNGISLDPMLFLSTNF